MACLLVQNSKAQVPVPLLQTLESLFCATDSAVAERQLDKLFNISPIGQQWPDEWLGTQADRASLHAGTLDIALQTLEQTATRFPSLREVVEQVALQWSYCEIVEDQQFYDLSLTASRLTKTLAGDPPLMWSGFQGWGFLKIDPPERFVPTILDEMRIAPSAYHLFLHRIYRQQCFPHPETGRLAQEEDSPEPLYSRERITLLPQQDPKPYPFTWQPVCLEEKPQAVVATVVAKVVTDSPVADKPLVTKLEPATVSVVSIKESPIRSTPVVNSKLTADLATQLQPKESGIAGSEGKIPKPLQEQRVKGGTAKVEEQTKKLGHKKKQQSPTKQVLVTRVQSARISEQSSSLPTVLLKSKGKVREQNANISQQQADISSKQALVQTAETLLPAVIEPTVTGRIPIYLEQRPDNKPQAHGTTGIVNGQAGSKKLRLAGSFADGWSLKEGRHTFSASVIWSPQLDWFVSSNISFKESAIAYAWSAGYADYKPGGWSAQLNNWGPIKPSEGLALDKAILNLGYRFKSTTLEKYKLSAASNLSLPVEGKPSLSGTLQWSPNTHWYARTTASRPLAGGDLNWHYAVGYNNPSLLGNWKLEYSNYGTNAFPGDNVEEGTLSIMRGWQF